VIGLLLAAQLLAGYPRGPVEGIPGWASKGPDGGAISALSSSPDGATVYAGTDAGLFKSLDGGASWRRLDSFPRYGFSSVIFVGAAPSNSSVVYAAENTPSIHVHSIDLYRSEDAGATWTSTGFGVQEDFFTKFNVVIDPTNPMTLYGSINCCSSKSTDGGRTWTAVPPTFALSISSIAIDPSNPSTLYGNAFVEDQPGHSVNHLQKSVDAGETWGSTGLVTDREFFVVDPDNPRILYAPGFPFARSDDGGLSISTETTSPGTIYSLALGGGTPRRLYASVADAGSIVLYTSSDRGATWSLAGAPPGGLDLITVTSASGDQDRILAPSRGPGGVFLSVDRGVHWRVRSAGLRSAYIGALAVLPSDGRFAYALGPGLAKTSDGGETWSADPFAPVAGGGGLAVDPTDPNVVYAADAVAGVRRSSDAGATWSVASSTGQLVTSIAIDPLHPEIVYAADGRPLKSIDGGGTWRVVSTGIPDGVKRVVVDASDPTIVYATSGPPYPGSGLLYRSIDAGETWSEALADYVDSIAPDPGHPGIVYAGGGPVWKSEDFGSSWTQVSVLSEVNLLELACDANGVLYAAGQSANPYFLGVTAPLRSDDGGATWRSIGGWERGAPSFPFLVTSLAVDLAGGTLFAGTEQGVWIPARRPRELSRAKP
jgi:photosystem II stability/assembly factor-like uncharacterized protein